MIFTTRAAGRGRQLIQDSPSDSDAEVGAQSALWRAMFESSGLMAGAFELLDDDYRYILANPSVGAFYGAPPSQMVGRTGRDLGVAEPHIARRLSTLRHCWTSGVTLTREYAFDHHGKAGWFLGTFSPIPGQVPRVSFVLIDVTERKAAQLEAERQQARLDLALTASGLGLWELEIGSDVVHWDQRAREIFGVAPDAAIDFAAYTALVDPRDVPEMRARVDAALQGENGGRYSIVHRLIGDGSATRWIRGDGQVLFNADGWASRMLGTVQDVSEEVASRETQAMMVAELNHRVKNNLATVQSIAAQSARRSTDLKQFMADFEGRLLSLARTHDVLTANGWAGAELSVLLERELSAFGDRMQMRGPKVELASGQAVAIALIVHELSTNAAKYGALSAPAGEVEVTWSFDDQGLALDWTERGGPPVATPAKQGFGSRLIEKLARGDLAGRGETRYAPEGLVFTLLAQPRG
jgi:PAS domain S-box-containing protein